MSRTLFLADDAATAAAAAALAAGAPVPAVVFLEGELGAGKSTLARAWLRTLGITGTVRSPTYTLVERYTLPAGEAVHLDLYRLADAGELEFLGLDELTASARLWLVEWPERGAGALPAPDLRLRLDIDGGGRRLQLVPTSAAGEDWLARTAF